MPFFSSPLFHIISICNIFLGYLVVGVYLFLLLILEPVDSTLESSVQAPMYRVLRSIHALRKRSHTPLLNYVTGIQWPV